MKISVVIPAYNCALTIKATLGSVLRQTVQPDEIIVMDDGSTDDTRAVLNSFSGRVTVIRQENRGAACARNALCERASGDLIAFLDSDDLWHPSYLEVQQELLGRYPNAAAMFTGHVNFDGYGDYDWKEDLARIDRGAAELIEPLSFFKRYNAAPGVFVMDCCVPNQVLKGIGREPFKATRAEDAYFFSLIALHGPVVYTSIPLVAYRMLEGSLSSNRMLVYEAQVLAFELLEDRYIRWEDPRFRKAFQLAFAGRRRQYAKRLMGAGKATEARRQLLSSLGNSANPSSLAKSLGLLLASCAPSSLQPEWPSPCRQWKASAHREGKGDRGEDVEI